MTMNFPKKIQVRYYASLREERGLSQETITTSAATAKDLFDELSNTYHFTLSAKLLKVAVNNAYVEWDTPINTQDTVIFIPPVSGG